MAAITRQRGAASSVLRLRNFEEDCLPLDLVFQDGRVMTPAEAKYPAGLRSIPLDERQRNQLKQPAAVLHLIKNIPPIPHAPRSLLLWAGIKTMLLIPFNLATAIMPRLQLLFNQDHDC